MRVRAGWSGPIFLPSLPREPDQYSNHLWHEWLPTKRHALLEYVPDVPAGAPAPLQLTAWKIQAMKLVILASTQGYVTREDFKHLRIDHRMWVGANGWLRLRLSEKAGTSRGGGHAADQAEGAAPARLCRDRSRRRQVDAEGGGMIDMRELPNAGRYACILADCPWAFLDLQRQQGAAAGESPALRHHDRGRAFRAAGC